MAVDAGGGSAVAAAEPGERPRESVRTATLFCCRRRLAPHACEDEEDGRLRRDDSVGFFRVSDAEEAKRRTITAREILSAGAAQVDQAVRSQPEIQLRLQTTVGDVFAGLGLYRDVQPLLTQAAATNRRVPGDDHPATPEAIANLAECSWHEGRYSEAEALNKAVAASSCLSPCGTSPARGR